MMQVAVGSSRQAGSSGGGAGGCRPPAKKHTHKIAIDFAEAGEGFLMQVAPDCSQVANL